MKTINFIQSQHKNDIVSNLSTDGYLLYDLTTPANGNLERFYRIAIESLPCLIPLSGKVHWDAFLDSVFEGITSQHNDHVAVIWNDAQRMIENSLSDFVTITDVFNQLAVLLSSDSSKIQFFVYIIGAEKNFS